MQVDAIQLNINTRILPITPRVGGGGIAGEFRNDD